MKTWHIIVILWLVFMGGAMISGYKSATSSAEARTAVTKPSIVPSIREQELVRSFRIPANDGSYMYVRSLFMALERESNVPSTRIMGCVQGMKREIEGSSIQLRLKDAAAMCAAILAVQQ